MTTSRRVWALARYSRAARGASRPVVHLHEPDAAAARIVTAIWRQKSRECKRFCRTPSTDLVASAKIGANPCRQIMRPRASQRQKRLARLFPDSARACGASRRDKCLSFDIRDRSRLGRSPDSQYEVTALTRAAIQRSPWPPHRRARATISATRSVAALRVPGMLREAERRRQKLLKPGQ